MDNHSIGPRLIRIRFRVPPGREPFYKLKGFKIGVAVALVAVVAFFHSNPKVSKWQPPELPTNTALITVGFGGNFFSNPVGWFDGTNSVGVAGSTHGFPFNVRVKNRRIFVEAVTLLDDTRQEVSISNEGDYRLPPKWDRNFTANVFEIVDATTNPVFQVIYNRPNQVTINGVFSLPDGGLLIAFNGSAFYSKPGLEKVDGAPAPPQVIPRKPLFKYPYWKYPGQFQQ
jgi:hypothetical protein